MKFIGMKAKLGHLSPETSTNITLNPEILAKVKVNFKLFDPEYEIY